MEFSWRTVMLLFGILTVIIIIFDGFRRMRRNREASLRLDIRQDFKFPSTTDSSEFPSGGFRVIDEEESRTRPEPAASSDQRSASKPRTTTKSADSTHAGTEEAFIPDYRNEPFFDGNLNTSGGSLLDPDISASLSEHTAEPAPTTVNKEIRPEPRRDSPRRRKVRHPDSGKARTRVQQSPEAKATSTSRSQQPQESVQEIADTDQSIPVLMSVDELGREETSLAMQPLRPDPETRPSEQPEEAAAEAEPASVPDIDLTQEALEDFPVEKEAEVAATEETVMEEESHEYKPLVRFANDDAECMSDRGPAKVALVIRVLSRDPKGFYGPVLLRLFDDCDLRYGKEGVFHRFEEANGLGPIQFSIAQAVEPGIFEPEKMESQHFEGLTFFMSLPGARRPMEAFRTMSELAKLLARDLDASLRDESDSVLSEQTLESYRAEVLEYERQQYLARRAAANRR